MYINKVDELIDRIIDDFYAVVVLKNKKFDKVKEELNFIKSQRDINDFLLSYIKTIPTVEINEIVKKGDSYNAIFDTIQKYIVTYTFITIGFFYKGKPDIFINNVIEFTKNQSEYPLKINGYFNSESNSLLIKLFYMCRNIVNLISRDSIKLDYIKKEPYAEETIEFLTNLSDEFINAAFRLKSLNNDVSAQSHNIIKTIIVLLVYKINDKKNLYNLIEQSELSEGEYMFIDIIEQITETLNFNTIESVLSKDDLFSGLAYDIWDYIEEVDVESKKFMSNEEKINILINSGIVIPILDDFLLYHRDNERYDKSTGTSGVKKKEDTKVRYIIGKIDTTTELYSDATKKDSKLRANIMKNFSAPFYNRKAILRNNIEEIKIINKFINQGKRNTENNDYFNDLVTYRRYTYINFKEFEKYGFSNHFDKTVTAVRAVSFDTSSEFQQTNSNHKLQLRVGSKDTVGNIVGFMIPSTTTAIQCIRIADVTNIRDLSKNHKNGFDLFLNFLKKSVIKGESHNSSVFWIFDLEQDKVKINRVESKENNSQQDIVKSMIAELYNRIVREIYFEVIDRMDLNKSITIDNAVKIIHFLEKNVLGVPLSKDVYEEIEKYIFEKKMVRLEDGEILENDVLYGLEGDTITLPVYEKGKSRAVNSITIDLNKVDESGKLIERDTIDGMCQHNITWDSINSIRKTDYSEYMKKMYEFIQQYVVENTSQEYVCKSCGHYLDIHKYIQDGVFDEEKGFITFSMPMETNLEDIPEYEKFHFSIKIMDKNIEKVAASVGVPYFVGSATTIKWRRKGIIKNTIDMVTQNNQLLSKTFKDRNETKTKLYGISKNLTSFFVFDMDNSIFQTSSKDKDQEQYKILKRNNIITYIMIFLMLELNESQISFFTADKKSMCDIKIFDKVYMTLFGGLRIKKNNSNDTFDVTKYKILCYLIYMISCRIAKHRLWVSAQVSEKNIQKMIPIVQRYIIHTCIDIINSILEHSFQPGVSYIFEIFRVRFYSKLNSLFSDNEYYKLLLEQNEQGFLVAKKRAHLKLLPPSTVFPFTYNIAQWQLTAHAKIYPPFLDRLRPISTGITNLSNCPDGKFHKWKFDSSTLSLVCTNCKSRMKDLKYSSSESEKIIEKYKIERSNLLAQKFCQVDGDFHQYVYDSASGKNVCIKCKKSDDYQYSLDELIKIDKILDDVNSTRREKYSYVIKENNKEEEEERKYIEDVVNKNSENMKADFDKENPYKFIDTFIDALQGSIGNEIKSDYPIQLRNNTYIIDHDHNGHDLGGKEIIITESDNKIFHKANHPHFKTDVIFYTDKTGNRVDVFYDSITRRLLGYKESSRDFVDIKQTDKKIRINYSIYNKLKLLGYTSEYININNSFGDIRKKYFGYETQQKISEIISNSKSNDKSQNITQEKSNAPLDIQIVDQAVVQTTTQDKGDSREKLLKVLPEKKQPVLDAESQQMMYREIVRDISRARIDRLKGTLQEFQRLFNRILNDHVGKTERYSDNENKPVDRPGYERESQSYFSDKMNSLVDKYRKKLKSVNIDDQSGKHRIFKHWKGIMKGICASNFDGNYFNFDSDLIESDNISRYDVMANMLLYYIIHEFSTLLKYNREGFIKTNISNFLVEFIDRVFFRYNTEHLYVNNDINRFMYVLNSVGFLRETEEQTKTDVPQGFYEEYVSEDEKTEDDVERQIDDDEEREALDVDMDEGDIEEGVSSNYDRQTEVDYDYEAKEMSREPTEIEAY
jgi:hypothetical protein